MDKEYLRKELEKIDNPNTTIADVQRYINTMIEVNGFTNETPQDVMLLLTEEIGELAKEVRKTTHIKMDVNKSKELDVEGEIADVFMYLLSLCRVMKIDLQQALINKEKINLDRRWE